MSEMVHTGVQRLNWRTCRRRTTRLEVAGSLAPVDGVRDADLGQLNLPSTVPRIEVKQRELFRYGRPVDSPTADAAPDLLHELLNEHHSPAANLRASLPSAIDKERNLLKVLGNVDSSEQPRNVLSASAELFRVSSFAFFPTDGVKGRLYLYQQFLSRTLGRLQQFTPDEIAVLYSSATDEERVVMETASASVGRIPIKTANGLEWRPLLDAEMVNEAVLARAAEKNPQGVAKLNELAEIRAMHVTVANHAVAEIREALGGVSLDA
jgi:hypothetical protein